MNKIRVLVVDDSSIIRAMLTKILTMDSQIEVVGAAPDPYVAREMLVEKKPDVMTLDIEMPRMDGVTFLEKVMKHMPIRTIVISSLSVKGSEMALRALEAGAIDVMAKPALDVSKSLDSLAQEIISRVKAVAQAKLASDFSQAPAVGEARRSVASSALAKTTHQILAIGASTGGTEALKVLLPQLPADLPGTVIVQHMPPVFTKTFAEHLQKLCSFEIREAKEGDTIRPGRVLLAPGNYHMEIVRSGGYYTVKLNQESALHGVRPAADMLFKSVAKHAGPNAIGVILTGMGRDGADGLLAMKKEGSYNLAQDEASCIVYGMPKAAVEIGAIHKSLALKEIANEICEQIVKREVA